MRFLQPEVLWHLLWILPAMLVIFLISRRNTARILKTFLGSHAADPEYVLVSNGKKILRFLLLCGAVFFLVLAAARPSWGVQIQEMNGQGRDLLFVFDVSKSMLAKDVQPSRLLHAKWLVKELVNLNPGDRFGLIAFAGKGFLECPLTSDKTSFFQTLDELSIDSIPVGGTNIQEALATALRAFRAAETQHRAVVLITDGDELEGDSGKAVDEIVARKIPLFIAGIGDPSQPSIIQVPDGKGGVKTLTDSAGNVVNSPLNEKQLGMLARRTGGIYVRSTAGDPGLQALEKRIRALAPQEYESVKTTKPIDRFSYPLSIAGLLLLIWFGISERSVRRGVAALLIVLGCSGLPLGAQSPTESTTPEEPLKTRQAVPPAVPEAPVSPEEAFNRGVEAQEKGDLSTAAGSYEEALRTGTGEEEIRGRATQNLGVIAHTRARAELEQALQSLQGQNLDEAAKKVDSSLKTLNSAESMYRDSMRETVHREALARNQSILLADRGKAENLKKKIDELKKLQQQTQQQTQQAKNQQQKENQQKQNSSQTQQGGDQQKQNSSQTQQGGDPQKQNSSQTQQGGDQQKQDSSQTQQGDDPQKQNSSQPQQGDDPQKQDSSQNQKGDDQQKQDSSQTQQGGNQQKQEQPSARQMTEQAEKSAEDLQKKAQEMGQKNLAESAKQAKEELEKARQEQNQGKGESAEEHLKKALNALGGENSDKKDGRDSKQSEDRNDNSKDSQKDSQQDSQKDSEKNADKSSDQEIRRPSQDPAGKQPEEGEMDKAQAASILEDMAKDEKDLRDAIKAYRKQRFKNVIPAKDW